MLTDFVTGVQLANAALLILAIVVFNWWYRSRKLDLDYKEQYILITGCDTGFGNRAAKRLDELGFNVFATCLTSGKVEELSAQCSPKLLPLLLDVTNDDSIDKALKVVRSRLPSGKGLWAVINNAGVMGTVGACEWFSKKHYELTIGVNFLGAAAVTKAFLPLIRRSQGRIVMTGSTLGRFPMMPAPYSVSKFCVRAYTDCLRREVACQGVSVHIVEPGGYRTNITDASLLTKTMDKVYNELDEEVQSFYGESYKKKLNTLMSLSSRLVWGENLDEVVGVYVHAVTSRHPKTSYVVGWNGNLIFRLLWTLPTWLVDFVMVMFLPKPEGA